MRLGVLDVGSNTVHLLVVDAHRGAAPLPAYSHKTELKLAEYLEKDGRIAKSGADGLVSFVTEAAELAEDKGCESLLAFATSALREAPNAEKVLDRAGRGPPHVPRRTTLVRLVVRAAGRFRHRWWIAGDRGRVRRGADGCGVRTAGRGPADQGVADHRPAGQ
jgi:hypothetical protein